MTRTGRFEPGEIEHIVKVDDTWECSVCKERYKPRRIIRFHCHKWMRSHVKCNKAPRHGQEARCSVLEDRGVGHGNETTMQRTGRMLDRSVRHFPYEVSGDGRDYGRKQARKDWNRRKRRTDKAICEEYPLDQDDK